jgi:hypothetical protein
MFALGAVLIQAIFATIMLWDAAHGFILASAAQRRAWTATSGPPIQWLAPAVWIVLYVAVVLGRWRAARWFALAAAIQAVYALAARPAPLGDIPDAVAVAVGLGVLPAVAVIAAFHQDAAPVPRTGPLIALPAGAILVGLWTRLGGPDAPAWLGIPDLPAIYCWLLLAATAGYAITRRVTGRLRAPGWTLGLALLAVPILAARVLGLAVYLGQQPGSPPGWLHTPTTIARSRPSSSA